MREVTDPAPMLTVQNIMSAYTRRMDKHDLEGVLKLFSEDCVIDYGDFGYYDGKDELREFLEGHMEGASGTLDAIHLTMNPYIEVDEDTAVGRWHYIGMNTIEDMGATWLVGFYTATFGKAGEEWQIEELEYEAKYVSPYDDGWAETPMAF